MLKNLVNLFFPPVCGGCHSLLLTNENVICTDCRHHLPQTYHYLEPENEAFKKFYGRIPVIHASAFLYFQKKGRVQELIHNLKYHGRQEIGEQLGYWYAEDLKKVPIINEIDVIVTVPIHKKRKHKRGFNQVDTFAEALSSALGIPIRKGLLHKKINVQTQAKKNFIGRMYGHQKVFEITYNAFDQNKHYLLVDDVLTTGATLEACSKVLLEIPGAKVSMVCMAIAKS